VARPDTVELRNNPRRLGSNSDTDTVSVQSTVEMISTVEDSRRAATRNKSRQGREPHLGLAPRRQRHRHYVGLSQALAPRRSCGCRGLSATSVSTRRAIRVARRDVRSGGIDTPCCSRSGWPTSAPHDQHGRAPCRSTGEAAWSEFDFIGPGPASASRREFRVWTDVEGIDRSAGLRQPTGLGSRDRAQRQAGAAQRWHPRREETEGTRMEESYDRERPGREPMSPDVG
jgi:hypothetical protein